MTHQLVRNRHLQPGNRRQHSGNCRKHWGNPNLHPPHRRPQPGNGRPQPGFDDNPCKIKVLRIFSAKVARATRPPRSATSPNGTVAWKRARIIVDSGGGHSARRHRRIKHRFLARETQTRAREVAHAVNCAVTADLLRL
jgi:hypothetical protein